MRSLSLAALALVALAAAGCRCDPPVDECAADLDCPDDGRFCTGRAFCDVRFGDRVCARTGSPCAAGQLCDEASRSCASCETDPNHPDCVDAGPPPPLTCEERVPGGACEMAGQCGAAECHPDSESELLGSVTASGGAGRPQVVRTFPGGYCGPRCAARARNDECGDCATCVGDVLVGTVRYPLVWAGAMYEPGDGVCRQDCTPTDTGTGCAREGYACDPETSTCLEACVDDRQCQIILRDVDGDGRRDLFDRGPSFPAYCDAVTGRCRTRGRPGAEVGDPCRDDDECLDDGTCLFNEGEDDGVCAIVGCAGGHVVCPPGTACDVRNVDQGQRSACLPTCEVGAEDGTAAMLGVGGGHPSCGAGRACVWNGASEAGPTSGSCVPGQYNAARAPNVAEACAEDAECYSPFGYGECFFREAGFGLASGMCTVRHCGTFLGPMGEEVQGLLPGVTTTDPVCDPARGEECVSFAAETSQTYCLKTCDDASECQPGYACAEVLASRSYCWPFCFVDAECGAGRCVDATGASCTFDSGRCTCAP